MRNSRDSLTALAYLILTNLYHFTEDIESGYGTIYSQALEPFFHWH